MAPGLGNVNVTISRIQRDQKYQRSPKMGYFLHYLDIVPIHLINVIFIGTYIMKFPNAKKNKHNVELQRADPGTEDMG